MSSSILYHVPVFCILVIITFKVSRVDATDSVERLDTEPETVEEFLGQVRETCQVNFTVDLEDAMQNMTACVSSNFNETDLVAQIREAVPKGNLDVVFSNICLKWPQMKTCMEAGLEAIELCWGQSTRNQLIKGMESVIQFLCGKDNDGSKAALFIAEGGLNCIENFGEPIGTCLSDRISGLEKHSTSICKVLDFFINCLSIMKKCSNKTPENLMTSMIREVGRVLECSAFEEQKVNDPLLPHSAVSFKSVFKEFLKNTDVPSLKPEVNEFVMDSEKCQNLEFFMPIFDSSAESELIDGAISLCHNVTLMLACTLPHLALIRRYAPQALPGFWLAQELCSENTQKLNIREILSISFQIPQQCPGRQSFWINFNQCLNVRIRTDKQDLVKTLHDKKFCSIISLYRHCILQNFQIQTQCPLIISLESIVEELVTKLTAIDPVLVTNCINSDIGPARLILKNSSCNSHNFGFYSVLFLLAVAVIENRLKL